MNHRLDESQIVEKASAEGVIPKTIRYGVMNNVIRGAMQTIVGDLYYFNYRPDLDTLRLVKADNPTKEWEAVRLLKSCRLGCDLMKSLEAVDDDSYDPQDEAQYDEPVHKADEGGSGGGTGAGNPASITEEEYINRQDDLMTEDHPGAAVGLTPDQPHRGKQWHQEEPVPVSKGFWTANDLVKGLNEQLKKATPRDWKPVSDLERQFLMQELGRSDEEVDSGQTHMTPIQKVRYHQWANKSLRSQLNKLSKWTK